MFIDALQKQNPALRDCAVSLLRQGTILPDTYVIDVDQFRANARMIKATADKYQIKLYAMTKQFGRNPLLARMLVDEIGYEGIVCVDFKEALHFQQFGITISHIGHLVQPPAHFINNIVTTIKPEVVTIYSREKAQALSQAASQAGYTQAILLKFYAPSDPLYPNQEAGFPLEALADTLAFISQLPNISIAGITHFPCFLYQPQSHSTQPTPNLHTAIAAAEQAELLGYPMVQINLPSSTSCETLPLIHHMGGTHGEPGHALTGTTPANQDGSQPEKIAMLYITEISHHFNDRSYCFGGGHYSRSQLQTALVYDTKGHSDHHPGIDNSAYQRLTLSPSMENNIDYYFQLNGLCPVGSPVVMAFRTQLFVTRSDVALVEGIASNTPRLLGIFDTQGKEIKR
ncbi:YhfX family PLP-dependent enzyme [Photobacterium nomapromontoriensis]|uniref:YhfX family PLP-dependent enzyme n=1 Tax=Photobacterium nomapromontoriensis TaxID=2910237 RepID=UPI003D11F80C